MWLFSKDSLSSFPYTKVTDKGVQLLNGWTLYNCTSKKGEELSMWVHETIGVSNIAHIQNAIKRMKTLKHPDIVNFVDSCEGAKEIQIVTERVQTLEYYLREKSDSGNMTFISSWGLYEVMRALVFLSETCKCRHNQVRLSSIFVNKSGDWKIGALDHVCGNDEPVPGTVIQSELYWPQDRSLVDSYGLGCLMWEIYNRTLSSPNDLKTTGSMPAQLTKVFQRLIHPRLKARITVAMAFKEVTTNGGLCDNYYVQTLLFLEEIQIKDEQEKKQFMATLSDRVDTFPDEINKFKVLPHLLTCHQFGAAGVEVLVPLVKLGKLLESAEFETKVVPCLVSMFRSSHRGTRVRLLEQLSSFIDHLPLKVVDQEIFPAVVLGMTDTNPVVREATVRSLVHLAPKLAPKSLNDILVAQIMNTQLKDDQGGIRTNATVCLAKMAPHLSVSTRQGHLLNVLLKCTRDPFTAARLNAVAALAACQHYFLSEDVATKLLPCLCFLTVDPESEVRLQTFKAVRFALTRLEQESENPGDVKTSVTENKEAQNSISWSNWAVNLSSRLMKKDGGEKFLSTKKLDNAVATEAAVGVRNKEDVAVSVDEMKKTENGCDSDDDEWAPLEEYIDEVKLPVTEKASNERMDHWQDPDSFFDKLITEAQVPVVKKGLKLGAKKVDDDGNVMRSSVVKKNVRTDRVIGGGGSNVTVAGPRGPSASTKKSLNKGSVDDGWGDTDW